MGYHSPYPIRVTEEDVDNNAGKDGQEEPSTPRSSISYNFGDALNALQPRSKSKQKQKQNRPKFSNSFSLLSIEEDEDRMNASVLFSENQGTYNRFDDDLQTALLLSKTQADQDDDDEELQKALLLSSMEFAAESNLGKGCDDSDLGELNFANPNLGDLKMNFAAKSSSLGKDCDSSDLGELDLANPKMKGICPPPEMNPDRVELAGFNKLTLGEASTSVCVLCSDELPTGKLIRLSDKCGHFCCRGCAGDYLGGAIKENICGEIKCPGNKCKETLSWFRCCRHVPPEVMERRDKALEEAKALKKLVEEEAAQREYDSIWRTPSRRNYGRNSWGHFGPPGMMKGRRNMMMYHHPDMMRDYRMRDSMMKGRTMKGRMMDPYFRHRFGRGMSMEEMELYEEEGWLEEFCFRYGREPNRLEYETFIRRQEEDRYMRYGRSRALDGLEDDEDVEEDEDEELDEEEDRKNT